MTNRDAGQVLLCRKNQDAPCELPLISFPWVKKEVVENNSRVGEKRRIVFKMAKFRRFGRDKNVVFGLGLWLW